MSDTGDKIINLGHSKRLTIRDGHLSYQNDQTDYGNSFQVNQLRRLTFIPFQKSRSIIGQILNKLWSSSNGYELYGQEGVEGVQPNIFRIEYKKDSEVRWKSFEIKSELISQETVDNLKRRLKKENKNLR